MRHRSALGFSVALLVIAIGSAGEAHAQAAWVGEQGSLDINFDYNLGISSKVLGEEEEFDNAGVTTHQLTLGAEYTPIEKLAVGVALPLALIKYNDPGNFPHGAGGSYDDGDTHATLTDLRAGVRYQVLAEPLAISPHLAFSIPVADYETVGNAVAGRGLKMLHAGLGIGKLFGPVYTQLTYEFTLAEKYDETADTEQYGQNRSELTFALGYLLLENKLDINLGLNFRQIHDGVTLDNFMALTPDEQNFHDPILKERILLVGGGLGYQLTDQLSLALAARFFVNGVNTQNANVFGLSLGWAPL